MVYVQRLLTFQEERLKRKEENRAMKRRAENLDEVFYRHFSIQINFVYFGGFYDTQTLYRLHSAKGYV